MSVWRSSSLKWSLVDSVAVLTAPSPGTYESTLCCSIVARGWTRIVALPLHAKQHALLLKPALGCRCKLSMATILPSTSTTVSRASPLLTHHVHLSMHATHKSRHLHVYASQTAGAVVPTDQQNVAYKQVCMLITNMNAA